MNERQRAIDGFEQTHPEAPPCDKRSFASGWDAAVRAMSTKSDPINPLCKKCNGTGRIKSGKLDYSCPSCNAMEATLNERKNINESHADLIVNRDFFMGMFYKVLDERLACEKEIESLKSSNYQLRSNWFTYGYLVGGIVAIIVSVAVLS